MEDTPLGSGRPSGEIRLLDVLALLAQRRRFVVTFSLACAAVALVVAFVMPHTFQAKISILPPEKSDRGGLSALLMSSPASSMLDLPSIGENHSSDYFLDVLRSRTIVDSMFADFPDVRDYFAHDNRLRSEQADAFANALNIDAGRDGLVTVTVNVSTGFVPSDEEQSRIAQLSARFAGGIAKELDKLTRAKNFSRAHNSRVYIEEQVQRVKHQLDSLYTQFTAFQREYKVLALDKQVESEVKSAADIQSQVMALEYQLSYLLHSQTPNNIEARQLRERISSLKEQYNKLQGGGDSTDYMLAFPQIPMLQKTYANMLRDLKAMEQVYAYLQTQYFQERVQEERDTPTVQVLDAPQVPERRSSPHRVVMLIIGLGVGFVVACSVVIVRQYVYSIEHHPDERARLQHMLQAFAPASRARRMEPAGTNEPESPRTGNTPPTNGTRS